MACSQHLQLKTPKGCSTTKLMVIGHSNKLWGGLTIGVGWLYTSFLSIGSSFEYLIPYGFSALHASSTNSTMMFSASTTFSLIAHILQWALLHFKEEMRLANIFATSFILNFAWSCLAKLALQPTWCKILDILHLFYMIWGFISLHTWEQHITTYHTSGTLCDVYLFISYICYLYFQPDIYYM